MTKQQLIVENEILKKGLRNIHKALMTKTEGKSIDYDYAFRVGVAQSIIEYIQLSEKIELGIATEN